jgi:uncharacterized protein (TIGR04255 family)
MFNPISGKHAISKVLAVLHLPQEVLTLEVLFAQLNKDSILKKEYQKRGLTSSKSIQIGNEGVKVSKDILNGFLFEEFNENGLTKNVLKLENFSNQKAHLTFECNVYDRWDGFIQKLMKDISIINKYSPLLVEAISLMYVDEFEWTSEENMEINLELLFQFKEDRSLAKLKETYNGGISMFSQDQYQPTEGRSEERTEIYVNKDINRVSIVHTCAVLFPHVKQFDKAEIKQKFDVEHAKNKKVLKELLIESVQKQVGLIN